MGKEAILDKLYSKLETEKSVMATYRGRTNDAEFKTTAEKYWGLQPPEASVLLDAVRTVDEQDKAQASVSAVSFPLAGTNKRRRDSHLHSYDHMLACALVHAQGG